MRMENIHFHNLLNLLGMHEPEPKRSPAERNVTVLAQQGTFSVALRANTGTCIVQLCLEITEIYWNTKELIIWLLVKCILSISHFSRKLDMIFSHYCNHCFPWANKFNGEIFRVHLPLLQCKSLIKPFQWKLHGVAFTALTWPKLSDLMQCWKRSQIWYDFLDYCSSKLEKKWAHN